jgi:tyrosine-protein kinase Etk/Wzc
VFSEGTLAFLEDQLRTYAERLKKSDQALEAFRQKFGVFSYDEQINLLLRERAALEAAQRQARVELVESQRKLEPLRRALEGPRPPDVMGAIQTDLIRLEGDAQARRARLETTETLLGDLERKIRDMERSERQLASIRRDIAQDEKNYDAYRNRVEEMRVSSALGEQSISNISVIDPGSVPAQPAGSRRAVMLLVGTVLAGLSAVIYAFVAEYVSQGMATPETVQKRLNLPVLASVQYFR